MQGGAMAHYRVLELLGSGGMGEVYLAEDTRLKRRIALKILPPGLADSRERLERFRLEAEAVAALNHPAIVTIYSIESAAPPPGPDAAGPTGGPLHFLTMELVQGRGLDQAIPDGGMDLGAFYELACRLVEGVAAAHAGGVIHRDLKPGNIMVTDDGRPKILDFGLAKLREEPGVDAGDSDLPTALVTEPGRVLGTPAYMAPEQARGGTVDARADLFALGAVLYEMLTGRRPFTGESPARLQAAILTTTPRSPRELRPELPRALDRLVMRCLERDPQARPASAGELLGTLRRQAELLGPGSAARERRLRKRIALPTVALVLALAAVAGWFLARDRRAARARREVLPQIERLLDDHRTVEAFGLARGTLDVLPDDPVLAELIGRASRPIDIVSEPPGAEISFQAYRTPDSSWHRLGTTPIEGELLPFAFLRFRIEKKGFDTLEVGAEGDIGHQTFELVAAGRAPEGMLWVPPGFYSAGSEPLEVPGFWLDRYEVTNGRFQEFVDAGGYAEPRYWRQPFELDGRPLERDEAMARLVDSTGRPGPATWSLGRHPEGEEDLPVRGVSWYEAAAYAEFAGGALPTLFHWRRAAPWSHHGDMLLLSNFESDAPRGVRGSRAVGRYGHVDLAGNVAEWCYNEAGGGLRYVLGGSWLEPSYTFTNNSGRSPLDRSVDVGFRLARFEEPPPAELRGEVAAYRHDFRTVEPVTDEVFAFYRSLYDYDPQPLEPVVEAVEEDHRFWRRETVTVQAAYGDERLPIHLFLPHGVEPPFQPVVYMPHSGARMFPSVEDLYSDPAFFVPRSGRALVWPVYQGTFERRGDGTPPRTARALRDELVQRVNDLQRTVDYLESRDDLRSDRLAYLGLSYGAEYGAVYTAIETRLRTSILLAGGFDDFHMLREPPETNPWNYAPRVTIPTLMINGGSDYGLPVATAQRPMFDLLATPPEQKRHVILEGGHLPFDWNAVYREALAWLDLHLGPVDSGRGE